MSKIIEKNIQIQTQEYLDKNGLLYKYQSGFCTNFSMDSCLVQPTDFILRGMDKGFHNGMILVDLQKAFDMLDYTILLLKDKRFHNEMILVDLQKAFDMLDHTILLLKMGCIGFKESVIKWF